MEKNKSCNDCRFFRPLVYPSTEGGVGACTLFSTYEGDDEYAGIYDDKGFLKDPARYENTPYVFSREEAGLAIPKPDDFWCACHEES